MNKRLMTLEELLNADGDPETVAILQDAKTAAAKDAEITGLKTLLRRCYTLLRRYANLNTGGSYEAGLLAEEALRQFKEAP